MLQTVPKPLLVRVSRNMLFTFLLANLATGMLNIAFDLNTLPSWQCYLLLFFYARLTLAITDSINF